MRRNTSLFVFVLATILLISSSSLQIADAAFLTPIEIIDSAGDGTGNALDDSIGIAVDSSGNVYVTGFRSDNAFKITSAGVITEIIDSAGDGTGNTLDAPIGIAVDSSGNVYVTGFSTNNAFKITSAGVITEIIDSTGDGTGNTLDFAIGIAVDSSGNVYVTGLTSDNAFKITSAGVITEIIDSTGDGTGNTLDFAIGIAVDSSGNVYVTGLTSDNAFKITSAGVITEIIDSTGDGTGNTLDFAIGIAVDSSGNVYVTGLTSDNAFKITSAGVITEIIDSAGDGTGNTLDVPREIAVDSSGNVYVAGETTDNAFKITSAGVITEIIDSAGDGTGNTLDVPREIAVDSSGNVYVAGETTDNAFKITSAGVITEIIDSAGDGTGNTLDNSQGIAVDSSGNVYVSGFTSDNAFKIPIEVTSVSRSTGGDDDKPPSYSTGFAENEYPISIDNTKFKFEELGFNNPTTIIETGKPIPVNLLIYDDEGPSYIYQVELYTNLNGIFRDVSNSDTSIIYKKDNPLEILDPNGFFSNVILSSDEVNQKLQLAYEITFAKEMEKSDIIVHARDTSKGVAVLTVSDAWQVIPAPTIIETTETPAVEPTDVSVPVELKVKTLNTDKISYFKEQEITFSGTVDGYDFGKIVTIIIRNPSNNFVTLISTFPDKNGYFETTIELDKKFKIGGTYTTTAFGDDVNKGTIVSFNFSLGAPPLLTVKTSPVQSTQDKSITTFEPTTLKPILIFVDPEKDPQSYIDRYDSETRFKEWFDRNYSDYTIYEAVGLESTPEETFEPTISITVKKDMASPEESQKPAIRLENFPDPKKSPLDYVKRYNNEPRYKEWFDDNFEMSIEDAVGYPETRLANFPDPSNPRLYYVERYNNEPIYKEWFDDSFPNQTFEEIIGVSSSLGLSDSKLACSEGKQLVFKSRDMSAMCISSVSAEKLLSKGWVISFMSKN